VRGNHVPGIPRKGEKKMKKALVIALVCLAASPPWFISKVMAQNKPVNSLKGGAATSLNNPGNGLDKMRAEDARLIEEINSLNRELTQLMAQKKPDQKKIKVCQEKLMADQMKLQQNMQNESELMKTMQKMMKAESDTRNKIINNMR